MRSKLPLVLAVIVGILGLVAVQTYIKKQQAAARAQFRGQAVWAAAADIRKGTELTSQMLVQREVPSQFIPPDALRGEGDRKLLIGRRTATALRSGQIIQLALLQSEAARGGLSSLIPAGESAFSVNISRGVRSGLLMGGDHIDIIGSFSLPKGAVPAAGTAGAAWRQASDMVNVVLLQNVTVLGVGDSALSGRESPTGGGDVTLALTLQESQLLMFASEHGELGAVLRREGVTETQKSADLPTVTFEEIQKIIGDLDGRRKQRTVEVTSGTRLEPVPVLNNRAQDKEKQP